MNGMSYGRKICSEESLLKSGPYGYWNEELLVVLLHVLHGGRDKAEASWGLLAIIVRTLLRLTGES